MRSPIPVAPSHAIEMPLVKHLLPRAGDIVMYSASLLLCARSAGFSKSRPSPTSFVFRLTMPAHTVGAATAHGVWGWRGPRERRAVLAKAYPGGEDMRVPLRAHL